MGVKVSAAVMAHESRAHYIPYLIDKLPHGTPVIWDTISSRWDTGRRAWLAYDPAATHHVVIQDDALLPNDLVPGLERIIPYVPPGHPMCLYVGKSRPYGPVVQSMVDLAGTQPNPVSWLIMRHINWGVGIVVPTAQIPAMVDYLDSNHATPEYDRRTSKWFESHYGRGGPKIHVWCPWPSLVEHRDGPSTFADRHGGRQAHNFIGEDASALTFDPTGAQLLLPRLKL